MKSYKEGFRDSMDDTEVRTLYIMSGFFGYTAFESADMSGACDANPLALLSMLSGRHAVSSMFTARGLGCKTSSRDWEFCAKSAVRVGALALSCAGSILCPT
jgi:hypothetical protein